MTCRSDNANNFPTSTILEARIIPYPFRSNVRVANLRTQIVRCADGGLGKGTGAFQDLEIHGGIKAMESHDANRYPSTRPWRYQSLLSSTCPVAFPAKKKHLSVTVHICALFKSVYNPPAHVDLQLPYWAFRHVPHVRSHTPIERRFVPVQSWLHHTAHTRQ